MSAHAVEIYVYGDRRQRRYRFGTSPATSPSPTAYVYRNKNGARSIGYNNADKKLRDIIDILLSITGVYFVEFEGTSTMFISLSCEFSWESVTNPPDGYTIEQQVANTIADCMQCDARELLASNH